MHTLKPPSIMTMRPRHIAPLRSTMVKVIMPKEWNTARVLSIIPERLTKHRNTPTKKVPSTKSSSVRAFKNGPSKRRAFCFSGPRWGHYRIWGLGRNGTENTLTQFPSLNGSQKLPPCEGRGCSGNSRSVVAQTIVCATSLSERYLEDIHVAKLYCATSFKHNRFVQGQIAR